MPHRIIALLDGHHADHFIAMFGTLIATVTSFLMMLADGPPTPANDEIKLLLMPLIGSLVATTGAYLLSPKEDTRKLAGRSIYSVAIGTALPVTAGFVSDYGRAMAGHPVALFLVGIIATTVVFVIIRPIIDKLFARSGAIADAALDAAQHAAHLPEHCRRDHSADANKMVRDHTSGNP